MLWTYSFFHFSVCCFCYCFFENIYFTFAECLTVPLITASLRKKRQRLSGRQTISLRSRGVGSPQENTELAFICTRSPTPTISSASFLTMFTTKAGLLPSFTHYGFKELPYCRRMCEWKSSHCSSKVHCTRHRWWVGVLRWQENWNGTPRTYRLHAIPLWRHRFFLVWLHPFMSARLSSFVSASLTHSLCWRALYFVLLSLQIQQKEVCCRR